MKMRIAVHHPSRTRVQTVLRSRCLCVAEFLVGKESWGVLVGCLRLRMPEVCCRIGKGFNHDGVARDPNVLYASSCCRNGSSSAQAKDEHDLRCREIDASSQIRCPACPWPTVIGVLQTVRLLNGGRWLAFQACQSPGLLTIKTPGSLLRSWLAWPSTTLLTTTQYFVSTTQYLLPTIELSSGKAKHYIRLGHACILYYPCWTSLSQWTQNGNLRADLFREFYQLNERVAAVNIASTIALNFGNALDNIFNLGTTGELAMNVEQK